MKKIFEWRRCDSASPGVGNFLPEAAARIVAFAAAFGLVASAQAQAAPTLAAPWSSFNTALASTSGRPVALATGDVDGDGDRDVLVARAYAQGGFVFLRNDGKGNLAAPVSYPGLNSGATDIVMADLDGDGDLDVAVTDSNGLTTGNTVSIYLGNGAGVFGARQAFSLGAGTAVPMGIAAADFDADGDIDLVVAAFGSNGNGSTIRLLRNNGNGSFAAAVSFPAGSSPSDIAAGDLTGDGRPDVVIANGNSGVTVLRNNGAGGFAAPVSYASGGAEGGNTLTAVAIADLDRDGDLDVLYTGTQSTDGTTGQIVQFRNDGTGTLTRGADIPLVIYSGGAADVAAADLTGDGAPDIIAASYTARSSDGVYVIKNDGAGGFGEAVLYPAGQSTYAVAAADLDGNGKLDVLTADDFSLAVTVRLNPGSGTFPVLADDYAEFIQSFQDAADIDGDGDLDIFTSGPHASASSGAILRNDGTGRFPSRTSITNPQNGVAAGVLRDLNGDGRPDLLYNNANTASQYDFFTAMNNGNGTFAAPTRWIVRSAGWGAIDAFDLDGDGDLDVVDMESEGAPNIPDGRFFIALNNGNGTFQTPYAYDQLPARPSRVVAGDFDKDGKLDLAMTNNGAYGFDTSVFIVRGHGNGTFDPPIVYTVGRGPLYLVTGDFDKDGNLDLATANTGYNNEGAESLTILFGTGTGTFNRLTTYYAPYSPDLLGATGIVAIDVDGDGDLDVMTTGVSNDIAVYLNDGAGVYTFTNRLGAVAGAHFPVLGDFTGDGIRDLAVLSARPAYGFDSGVAVLRGLSTLLASPTLSIARSGENLTLSWPVDSVGFKLQSSPQLTSPTVWSDVAIAPTVIGDKKVVTQPINSSAPFYRLLKP